MSDKVFISYSSKDAHIINRILKQMQDAGIEYWKAPEMIPAGSNYAREIPRAIDQCQVFVLMISEASQDSIWVEKEVDCAINARKTIVPLNLTGTPMTEMFRFYLNNVQTIMYSGNEEQAMQQFLERLKGLISGGKADAKEKSKAEKPKAEKPAQQPYSNSFSAALKRMPLPEGRSKSSVNRDPVATAAAERSNALSMNQIPVACQNCGGKLTQVSRGTYCCVECGKEEYDSYQKVRNYLDKEGPRSVTQIMHATGVPRATIEYFLRDERLEIPVGSSLRLVCRGCGELIRTGVLCDRCKKDVSKTKIKTSSGDDKYRFIKRDK